MEKVVIYVGQHSRAGPKVVEGALQALWVRAILRGSNGGVGRCYLKYNRCLLVGYGSLCDELVDERVPPRKVDANLGKTQLEQLKLSKVLVQQIAS